MTQPIRADRIKEEKVEWLWRGRVPKGMISVGAGKRDQGKGLFAAHLAADVSRRGGKVLYSAAEDSHTVMTRPRLRAAGADLRNILLWRFQLPRQFKEFEAIVRKHEIALVVIDPLASHLSAGASRHGDTIRLVTDPLTALIEQTGTAVWVNEHVLKRVPHNIGDPLDAIGGSSSGLVAAARMGFLFGTDPADEDRRVLACVKANISEKPRALAFELDTVEMGKVGHIPVLLVDEEMEAFDPVSFFAKKGKGEMGRPPDKRASAAEWLTEYLVDAGKPVPAGRVFEDAKQVAMSSKTLRRAATDLKIVKSSGGRGATWDLPLELKERMGLVAPAKLDTNPIPAAEGGDWDAALGDLLGGGDDDA